MAIKIKGVIGYDVIGVELADKISHMTGDITIEIDSPGGAIIDGISIFNAINNYDRGKKIIKVVGEASSMAGYIMMAGDDLPIFEANSICVLHNPWSVSVGDYREMKKKADILERLSDLYADVFVKKGVFQKAEIRKIMDEETWFIGAKELSKLGTVNGGGNQDDDSDNTEEPDREIVIAAAKANIKEAQAKLMQKISSEELDKIAALLPKMNCEAAPARLLDRQAPAAGISGSAASAPAAQNKDNEYKNKGEKTMENLSDLKAENPKIYNEAVAVGVKAENERVNRLMAFMDKDKEAVLEALKNGHDVTDPDFQAKLLQTRLNGSEINAMKTQNPPAINPKAETHAPENEGQEDVADEAKKKADEEKKEAEALATVLGKMGFSVEEAKEKAGLRE